MTKNDKEKINCKELSKKRWDVHLEIMRLKSINPKSEKDYKTLISTCNELVRLCDILDAHGYKPWVHKKHSQAEYWKGELDKYLATKLVSPKIKESIIQPKIENLYYLMLCWTTKSDHFAYESIIDKVKGYFEKLKSKFNLEFLDTMTDSFPDRKEHTMTYKIRTSPEVYESIISSANYILDITSNSLYDTCNIGVFGKKIE